MFDVLVRNGTVIDGSGKPRFVADVGVEKDRITLVDKAEGATAKVEIDASGKIVCPGFVDPHSHADLVVWRPDHTQMLEPLVRQGITTFVGGNCGFSLAPVGEKNREIAEEYTRVFTGVDEKNNRLWSTMGAFFDTLESQGVLLNTAILAPHGLLRISEVGSATRYAKDEELRVMAAALDQALEEGAIGLSTGLQYFPGNQSDTRELVFLGQTVKKHDGIYASHLRSYCRTLDLAIDEIIEVARTNDIRAQISHIFDVPYLGIFGRPVRALIRGLAKLSAYWTPPAPLEGPMRRRIRQMMKARDEGVQLGMDSMPTTTGFTHLLAFFPPWVLVGNRDDVIARLRSPEERAKMLRAIEHGSMQWPHVEGDSWSLNFFQVMGWECVRIMAVASDKNRRLEGMRLVDIARERKRHPLDTACDLLLEEGGHVLVFESMAEPEDNLTERTILPAVKHPQVSVSTDTLLLGIGKPSHLFYGCYPKFISRYVRQMKLLSLETAIRKMTGLPAEHFGIKDRGRLEEGCYADMVIFDFDEIAPRSTFNTPDRYPVGIEHVFINGKHIVDGDAFNPDPRPGRVLRHGK